MVRDRVISGLLGAFAAQVRYVTVEHPLGFAALLIERFKPPFHGVGACHIHPRAENPLITFPLSLITSLK